MTRNNCTFKYLLVSTVFFIVFFLITMSPGFALDPRKEITQYVYDSWTTRDGLPINSIPAIAQDSAGYLWLGTWEGLVRFDGVMFVVYDKNSHRGLAENRVRSLHCGKSGTLWIGTHSGLSRIDNGEISLVAGKETFSHPIRSIYELPDGNLSIGTLGGGFFVGMGGNATFKQYTMESGLPHNSVISIYFDQSGNLWLATKGGLARVVRGNNYGTLSFQVFDKSKGLSDDSVNVLYEGRPGKLWVGTENGLNIIERSGGKFEVSSCFPGTGSLSFQSIAGDKHGTLWLGTTRGLGRIVDDTFLLFPGIGEQSVISLFYDREKDLWIGLRGGGLGRLRDGNITTFRTENGLVDNIAWAIIEAPGYGVLCGTDNAGLNRFNPETGKFHPYLFNKSLTSDSIRSLCFDSREKLWVGFNSGGLRQLEDGKLIDYTHLLGGGNKHIRVIYEDREGILWIGTEGEGLYRLEYALPDGKVNVIHYTTLHGLSSNLIMSIHEDDNHNLWVGTENGLNLIGNRNERRNFSPKVFTTRDGLPHDAINVIARDHRSALLIGTYGGGLSRYEDGKFENLTVREGLFDNTIHHILADDRGNFWMSSNQGIFMLRKSQYDDYFLGAADKVHCEFYNESDGMKSRECNGLGSPAGCRGGDGKLWFPTVEGASMIDPARIRRYNTSPPVQIQEIITYRDFEKNLSASPDPGKRMKLKAGTRRLEIHFAGISIGAGAKVCYKYKLEGYDSDWSLETRERKVSYTGLAPDDYTFLVSTVRRNGSWNENPADASFSFRLEPHFYQTYWFYFACVLAVSFIIYIGYRVRVRQLKKRKEELEFLVKERTEELEVANLEVETVLEDLKIANQYILKERNNADRANRAKSDFLANMSHEIRTPMNAIVGFSDILASEIKNGQHRQYLKNISSSGKLLLDLINDILDLSRIEAGKLELQLQPVNPRAVLTDIKQIFSQKVRQKALDFQLEIDPVLPETLLMDSLRLRQVIFNLVGNAVKFTHTGCVKLSAHKTGARDNYVDVDFIVRDTGIGISPDQQQVIFEAFKQHEGQSSAQYGGTGLGLAITRRLVQLMGGEIFLQSEEGEGSSFRVSLKNVRQSDIVLEDEEEIRLEVENVRFKEACVLIADDNPLNRQLLLKYLQHSPITCIEAENGKEAVALARQYRPDLVLMDLKMPVMDGCEATMAIKADEELQNTPVIIVTGSALKEQRAQVEKACGDGLLLKPVGKSDLIIELMYHLTYYTINGDSSPVNEQKGEEAVEPSLTPEIIQKLPGLVSILRGDEVIRRFEEVRKQFILDEIENFSQEMTELDRRYRSGILSRWAGRLMDDLQTFNPEKIKDTLLEFPGIIKEIENITGS